MIELVIGILFVIAFSCKLNDIRKEPTDLGAWAVLVFLCVLAFVSLIRDGAPALFGEYGIETGGVLLRNIALVVGFAGLQLWHLRNVSISARGWRVLIEVVVLLATIVAMCVITASLPDGVGLTASDANLAFFEVVLFYYVAGGYTLYCLGSQLYWNAVFARVFRQRLLKAAAVLTGLGDLFLICAHLSREVGQSYSHFVSGVRPALTHLFETSFIVLGMPLLIVGLLLPPIVGGVRRLASLCTVASRHRRLRSLHEAVAWAYPGLIRPTSPGAGQSRTAVAFQLRHPIQRMRLAYTDRIQQCRDGYARSRNADAEGGRPTNLAQTLQTLPEVHASVDLSDERQQTAHLLAVSRALRRHGPVYANGEEKTHV